MNVKRRRPAGAYLVGSTRLAVVVRIHLDGHFGAFQVVAGQVEVVDHLDEFALLLVALAQVGGADVGAGGLAAAGRIVGQRAVGARAVLLADRVGEGALVDVALAVDAGARVAQQLLVAVVVGAAGRCVHSVAAVVLLVLLVLAGLFVVLLLLLLLLLVVVVVVALQGHQLVHVLAGRRQRGVLQVGLVREAFGRVGRDGTERTDTRRHVDRLLGRHERRARRRTAHGERRRHERHGHAQRHRRRRRHHRRRARVSHRVVSHRMVRRQEDDAGWRRHRRLSIGKRKQNKKHSSNPATKFH